jgi:hypothetical protein
MAIGRIPEPGTGIPESILDAKGDLISASAADTPARLAVGTNDQRLVAASGETTGLKWVADTQNTVVDAKGDLIVGTGADTVARLAVGTNGHTLVADSSETTGLKWQAASSPSYTWAAWTPASRNDITIGNGTETARYVQIGNVVFWFYKFVFGSTSSISSSPSIQLPAATTATWEGSNTVATFIDANGSQYEAAAAYIINDKVQFKVVKSDGTYATINDISGSIPFSWTTSDYFVAYGSFEV